MRLVYPILLSLLIPFLVGCCTSSNRSTTQLASNYLNKQAIVATTKEYYPPKNPQHIFLYTNENKPLKPYRIIGIATVSKHNLIGTLREQETLDAMMKKLAASIGGDAVIKIANNDEQVEAHVIQFQRIFM